MTDRVPQHQVSTTNEIPGCRTVRSRSVVGNLGAALQTIVGGNISICTELMLRHAAAMGANGVVAMRHDANEVAQGVTEVLAYGTAVQVEAST